MDLGQDRLDWPESGYLKGLGMIGHPPLLFFNKAGTGLGFIIKYESGFGYETLLKMKP
jgi:hypothetical protein